MSWKRPLLARPDITALVSAILKKLEGFSSILERSPADHCGESDCSNSNDLGKWAI